MDKKFSFGLIGCGRIGGRHAEHILSLGKLIAVCDVDKQKADDFSKKYQVPAYYSIDDLLAAEKSLDILSVCTPNGLHAIHSIKALKAGLHVLCEKPLAISVVDCQQMIDTAVEAGKKLFVVKQNRFNPPVQAVKKLLDNGTLGKIFSMQLNCFWNRGDDYYKNTWHGSKELDGGILYTQFSHFIDLLYWYFGDVVDVKAMGGNFAHKSSIEFDDTVVALLHFKSGILGTLHCTINSHQQNMEGSLTIFGESGTVKIGGQYLNELEYQNISAYTIAGLSKGNLPNNYGNYTGSMSNHGLVYQNVINTLTGSERALADMYDGLKTVEIVQHIYDSLQFGG